MPHRIGSVDCDATFLASAEAVAGRLEFEPGASSRIQQGDARFNLYRDFPRVKDHIGQIRTP
jgi:hypothetical protein